ncbi:MAG: ribosomal protein S19 family protein [Clostridiales bacterium]|nr:ribosomal protein S19 family protein [Clostridiales bacterium]
MLEKVNKARETGSAKAIRTWSRSCSISPEMVGVNFEVYNGKDFNAVSKETELYDDFHEVIEYGILSSQANPNFSAGK